MIAKGFKSVGWVAAVAGAALSCYMLSLQVASERADVSRLERSIIAARQDIRSLQTELGTRGRLQQLERWNAEVLALSAPVSGQFIDNEVTLARFDVRQPTFEERTRVQLASAEQAPQSAAQPAARAAPQLASATRFERDEEPEAQSQQPMVRRAALVVSEPAPAAAPAPARETRSRPAERRQRLVDERAIEELGAAERGEQSNGGTGN